MASGRIIIPNYMPALDLNGAPVRGAKIYFFRNQTTDLQTIYADAGLTVPHANPVTADAGGVFPSIFADLGAIFTVAIRDANDAPIGGLRDVDSVTPSLARVEVQKAESLAALRNMSGTYGQVFVASRAAPGDGYCGTFEWISGDQSGKVTADPWSGIWVAPTDETGSAGAWRRAYSGVIDPVWFGGRTSAALQAALNYAKATGPQTIRPEGSFTMSATVVYRGSNTQGVVFDGTDANFYRTGDYGPTFDVSGLANGTALQRATFLFGGCVDVDESMTAEVSKAHIIFDHVYYLDWGAKYIRGGCGGVRLQGCAATRNDMVGQAWRFEGAYRGDNTAGLYVGPSTNAASGYYGGGDHAVAGLPDVYAGQINGARKVSSKTSDTVVVLDSVEGVAVGDIITGHGLSGTTGYEFFQRATTITAINAATRAVTLSKTVGAVAANYQVALFRPALAYGYEFAGCDGFWGAGTTGHAMMAKIANVRIRTQVGVKNENMRLSVMPDYTSGYSLIIEGEGFVGRGYIDVHHCYGSRANIQATAERQNFRVFSGDEGWDFGGATFGGAVRAPSTELSRTNGKRAFGMNVTSSGLMNLTAYNADETVMGNIFEFNTVSRTVVNRYEPTFSGRSVAQLSQAPMTSADDGTVALCYNVRRLTVGGTLEGAGAGGLGLVVKSGTKWYLNGTNIEAQA